GLDRRKRVRQTAGQRARRVLHDRLGLRMRRKEAARVEAVIDLNRDRRAAARLERLEARPRWSGSEYVTRGRHCLPTLQDSSLLRTASRTGATRRDFANGSAATGSASGSVVKHLAVPG